ncbi:MAG: LapA family protein [Firmicutes bacterium]|nr:LapA family protein [Dethiobacter sp.]MBS3889232.1 LapA family protein [Bacillota bacterium]MBS4053728.1 LapA family protein [Thermaerobacter sp.]
MPIKLVFFSVLALVVALFALENSTLVAVRFLGFTFAEVPLAAVIIGLFTLGITVGVLFSLPKILFCRGRIRDLERELAQHAPQVLVPPAEQQKDAK